MATTPFGIPVVSNPEMMQVSVPGALLQVTDLLAPVAAGPAATVIEDTSLVEYVRVHSSDAGETDPAVLTERSRLPELPSVPEPDDKLKLTL